MVKVPATFFDSLTAVHRKWAWSLFFIATTVLMLVIFLQVHFVPGTAVEKVIQTVAAIFSLTGLFAGYRRYQAAIASSRDITGDSGQRQKAYRKAVKAWWAMNAFPAIFSFLGFLITAQFALFLLGLFHSGVHFTSVPRRKVIQFILQIPESEKELWGL